MMNENDVRDSLAIVTKGTLHEDSENNRNSDLNNDRYQTAIEKLHRKCDSWVDANASQGFGLGAKLTNGQYQDEIVLRAYVKEKKPVSKLKSDQKIPKSITIPEIGRVKTDVIEIGKVELHSLRSRVRPAAPGCSIGHKDRTSGSIGCVVKVINKSGLYLLSSAHILSDMDQVDNTDVILQPSPMHAAPTSRNQLATLSYYSRYDFTRRRYKNKIDAAVAKVKRSNWVTENISLLGVSPRGIGEQVRVGDTVKKVGPMTGLQVGVVQDVDYTFAPLMPTGNGNRRRAGFSDQVLCTRIAMKGDSGSGVLDEKNKLVGLHMAGSNQISIFNKIHLVFQMLSLQLP